MNVSGALLSSIGQPLRCEAAQHLRQVLLNPDDSTQEPSTIVQKRDTAKSGALVFYFEDPESLPGILS